jgi:hypothetical protein
MTYPTIVVLVQNSDDLANLQLELIVHGWLKFELNTVNSITRRTIASRSRTCEGRHRDCRSHTGLTLGLGTGRAKVEGCCSGTRHGATLKLDGRAEGTLFGNR